MGLTRALPECVRDKSIVKCYTNTLLTSLYMLMRDHTVLLVTHTFNPQVK